MVSIEPVDSAADGTARLAYREGGQERGRVIYRVEGEEAVLLRVDAGEPLVADALVRAMLHAADLRGARTVVCTDPSVIERLTGIGFVKSDKGARLSLREFFDHPCQR